MKKIHIVAIMALVIATSCGKKEEGNHTHDDGSTHANHEKAATDSTQIVDDASVQDSIKQARIEDSVRQVKEHGHAH